MVKVKDEKNEKVARKIDELSQRQTNIHQGIRGHCQVKRKREKSTDAQMSWRIRDRKCEKHWGKVYRQQLRGLAKHRNWVRMK